MQLNASIVGLSRGNSKYLQIQCKRQNPKPKISNFSATFFKSSFSNSETLYLGYTSLFDNEPIIPFRCFAPNAPSHYTSIYDEERFRSTSFFVHSSWKAFNREEQRLCSEIATAYFSRRSSQTFCSASSAR